MSLPNYQSVNLKKFLLYSLLLVFNWNCNNNCCHAAVLPLTWITPPEQSLTSLATTTTTTTTTATTATNNFGYIEYKPNGTLVLRSAMENGTNTQNLLLFKAIVSALKLTPNLFNDNAAVSPATASNSSNNNAKWNIKIYGEGVEHRFPAFMERIIQRIQTYFSVYKYIDTSRPAQAQTADQPQQQQANVQQQQEPNLQLKNSTEFTLAVDWLDATTSAMPITLADVGFVEGSGSDSIFTTIPTTTTTTNNQQPATFVDIDDDFDLISIGENDTFITVGED